MLQIDINETYFRAKNLQKCKIRLHLTEVYNCII